MWHRRLRQSGRSRCEACEWRPGQPEFYGTLMAWRRAVSLGPGRSANGRWVAEPPAPGSAASSAACFYRLPWQRPERPGTEECEGYRGQRAIRVGVRT